MDLNRGGQQQIPIVTQVLAISYQIRQVNPWSFLTVVWHEQHSQPHSLLLRHLYPDNEPRSLVAVLNADSTRKLVDVDIADNLYTQAILIQFPS
jgi:hypothetical protein